MGGITFDGIASTEIDSTTFSGTNITLAGSVTGRLIDSIFGQPILATGIGSPGNKGARIEAGSVGTSAGSVGTLNFAANFTTADVYAVILTPFSGGSIAGWISGIQNISGCEMVGGPSNRYWWMAIGR